MVTTVIVVEHVLESLHNASHCYFIQALLINTGKWYNWWQLRYIRISILYIHSTYSPHEHNYSCIVACNHVVSGPQTAFPA